jgi:hypothetical protein
VNGFYRDKQVYVDALNAILVESSLFATMAFAAWLQPLLRHTLGAMQENGSHEVYTSLQQHPLLEFFWILNTLFFFFAVATMMAGAEGVLPKREGFIKSIV